MLGGVLKRSEHDTFGIDLGEAADRAVTAIDIISNLPKADGRRPGFRRVSQLRVKLGTTRPPIMTINMMAAAIPSRVP